MAWTIVGVIGTDRHLAQWHVLVDFTNGRDTVGRIFEFDHQPTAPEVQAAAAAARDDLNTNRPTPTRRAELVDNASRILNDGTRTAAQRLQDLRDYLATIVAGND